MEFADLFRFDKFVAPVLIKVVYWIGLVLIAIGTIGGIVGTSMFSSYYSGSGFSLGGALVSILLGALGILVWRVVCEIWIVIFSVNDRLGTLVDLKKAERGE